MDRQELEMLTRDELLALARTAGIDGAEWLSREELVTSLSRPSVVGKPFGIIDKARKLFDRAVELGQKIGKPGRASEPPPAPTRTPIPQAPASGAAAPPEPTPPSAADEKRGGEDEFETLTMAEVHAAQGLTVEALRIARGVLAREPDNAAARELVARLEVTKPVPPGPAPGPLFLDLEEPPERYGEDVVSLLMVSPSLVYAYWEITPEGFARARDALGELGHVTLRLVSARPSGLSTRDERVHGDVGDFFFQGVMAGARHRVAIGVSAADGRFMPIAHSSSVWTPPAAPSDDTRVEWMEVRFPSARGRDIYPPDVVGRSAGDVRAQARARRRAIEGWPMGSSERMIGRGKAGPR